MPAPCRSSIPLLLLLIGTSAQAQDLGKGDLYLMWGWNRSDYTTSDIRFTGRDNDFTLYDVRATDRPTPVSPDYLNPLELTVPQTNFRVGWFFHDRYSLSVGFDHMKYVVGEDQLVRMDGRVGDNGSPYAGTYVGERVALTRDFLTYEHSDGLNFIHLQLARHDRVARIEALRLEVAVTGGFAAGVLVPRTACRLMGKPLSDDYHLSGFGTALKAGTWLTLFRRIVVAAEFGGGFITMPDVRASLDRSDRASQRFWFTERSLLFGYLMHFGGRGDRKRSPGSMPGTGG